METKKYCAFWYPTIFHQTNQINPIAGQPVVGIDISDKAESTYRLFLDVQETAEGNLVFETYNKAAGTNEKINVKTLTLTLEQHSNNGFSIYSYTEESIDFDHYLYKNVFYHHAKSLHHRHEVNHDSDSSLSALVIKDESFDPKDIFTQDNIVIQDYLLQYEVLFGEIYAKEISRRRQLFDKLIRSFKYFCGDEIKNRIKKSSSLLDLDKSIHVFYYSVLTQMGKVHRSHINYEPEVRGKRYYYKLIRKIRRIQGEYFQFFMQSLTTLCGNAAIEYTYCQTLLNSKYNTVIKPNIEFSSNEIRALHQYEENANTPVDQLLQRKDQSRKTANNILNSIRYIECVKYKCTNRTDEHIRYVLDKAEKSNKHSMYLSIAFGVITVISLVVTFVSMCHKESSTQGFEKNDNKVCLKCPPSCTPPEDFALLKSN